MGRVVGRRCAAVTVLAVMLILPTGADLAGADVAGPDHLPPTGPLVAGDPVTLDAAMVACPAASVCAPPTLTVHYASADGEVRRVSTTAASAGVQTLSVTIPGDDVRFPELSYWLEMATVARPGGVGPAGCDVIPSPCLSLTERWPQAGARTLAVDTVVRATFVYPDGRPAAGVRVVAEPQGADHVWAAVTDPDGHLALTVPRDDAWVTAHASETANVFLWAFDAWPAASPAAGQPVTVDGHGVDVGVVVNLGDPDLAAVHDAVQDQVFTLDPQRQGFVSSADAGCIQVLFGPWVCRDSRSPIELAGVPHPVADNVGAGADMTSTFSYEHSKFTRSTFLVRAGAGWVKAEGEVQAEQNQAVTSDGEPVGPHDNRQFTAAFDWARERTWTCFGEPGEPGPGPVALSASTSADGHCTAARERTYKWRWGVGTTFDVQPEHHHDQATPMQVASGSDCVVEVGKGTSVTHAETNGERHKVSLQVGGEVHNVDTRTGYSSEAGSGEKVVHRWSVPANAAERFHHVYVPGGFVNNDLQDPATKCPVTHPGETWTDAARIDKTRGGAGEHCGRVIRDDYTLREDIGPCLGDGLVVGADGVTIDLNGHSILGSGVSARGEASAAGIRIGTPPNSTLGTPARGFANVVVTDSTYSRTVTADPAPPPPNSRISGFAAGVAINGGSGNTVRNLWIADNGQGVGPRHPGDDDLIPHCGSNYGGGCHNPDGHYGDGIFVIDSSGNTIQNNVIGAARTGMPAVPSTGSNGPYSGVGLYQTLDPWPTSPARDNRVLGNVINGNHRCFIFVCQTVGAVVWSHYSTVDGNIIGGNALDGIALFFGAVHNDVVGNEITANGRDGVRLWWRPSPSGPDHAAGASYTLVEGNRICGNRDHGVWVGSVDNIITGNQVGDLVSNPLSGCATHEPFDLKDANPEPPGCDNNTWSNNDYTRADPAHCIS